MWEGWEGDRAKVTAAPEFGEPVPSGGGWSNVIDVGGSDSLGKDKALSLSGYRTEASPGPCAERPSPGPGAVRPSPCPPVGFGPSAKSATISAKKDKLTLVIVKLGLSKS